MEFSICFIFASLVLQFHLMKRIEKLERISTYISIAQADMTMLHLNQASKLESLEAELNFIRSARTKQLIEQQAKPSQPTIAQVDAEFQRRQEYKELKALKQ